MKLILQAGGINAGIAMKSTLIWKEENLIPINGVEKAGAGAETAGIQMIGLEMVVIKKIGNVLILFFP